jgi:Na+-transporting NADH:ubiquinone oxidoreductase subunit B
MDMIGIRNKAGLPGTRSVILPVRSSMNTRALSAIEFSALLLPMGVTVFERSTGWLWLMLTIIMAALIWQRIFAEVRHRPFIPDGLIPAIAIAIILPTSVPLWQAALSVSFGIVLGQEIFGGRGRNFLNPAIVALAFFVFSFPGRPLDVLSPAVGLSVLPGALLLLLSGVISWRVIIGAAVGLLFGSALATTSLPPINMTQAGFVFGLVFFAADPVAAASTNSGRWLHGLVFGSTAALLAGASTPIMETVVSAALLTSILAPLIDGGVLTLNAYQRGRRYG